MAFWDRLKKIFQRPSETKSAGSSFFSVIPYKKLNYNNNLYEISLIRSVIDYFARSISQIPLVFYDKKGDPIKSGTFQLQMRPNAKQSWTEFVELTFKQKLLKGISVFDFDGKEVRQLPYDSIDYSLPSRGVAIYYPDPHDPNRYLPIQSSQKAIIERHVNTIAGMTSLAANAPLAGIITIEDSDTLPNEKAIGEAEEIFRRKYGGGFNAGKVGIVRMPVKFEKTFLTIEESGLIDLYMQDLRDICRAYGIPSMLMGDDERSTYNNIVEAKASFYYNTLMPELDQLCEKITMLVSSYLSNIGYSGGYLLYEKSSIPVGNFSELFNAYLQLHDRGLISDQDLLNIVKR